MQKLLNDYIQGKQEYQNKAPLAKTISSPKLIKHSKGEHISSIDSQTTSLNISSEFKKENELIIQLKTLPIPSIFPKSINYPSQKFYQNIVPNSNNNNNNLKRILEQNNKKPSYFGNHYNINFHSNSIIYEICIERNLIIAIGENLLRVYDLDIREFVSTYSIPNEKLYCLSVTSDINNLTAAVGGRNLVIRIIDIIKQKEINQLIGHKNEIYDLKFCPTNKTLLLSASKDSSIRLWNILRGIQLVIFGGPLGHSAEVLSIDWHLSGEYFVSGGIDNCVKLWEINNKIRQKINGSNSPQGKFIKTLIKTKPMYSCNSIHDNYIDCVRFNGNFVISKSVHGEIKEWLPIFNKEGDSFYLIKNYVYEAKDRIWYIKFCLDLDNNILLVGNEKGIGNLFLLGEHQNIHENDKAFPDDLIDTNSKSIIRSIGVSKEYAICAFGTNKGEIIIEELKLNKE